MPVKKIRFAQQETGRGANPSTPMVTKDWEFLNLTPEVVVNPMTQGAEVWATTFTGTAIAHGIASGNAQKVMVWSGNSDAIVSTGVRIPATDAVATINVGNTEVGTVLVSNKNSHVSGMSETKLNGDALAVFIITSISGSTSVKSAWYFGSDAGVDGTTFSGDTHTNTTIDGITSTTGMYPGQTLSGTGIQAGTVIASVDSATAITTDLATTATNNGVTITRSALAKIVDVQFPSNQTPARTIVGNMVHADGYSMIACTDGTLWVSDLNSLTSWTAASFVSADSKPDSAVALGLINNTVVVFGSNTIEFFENAGLSSGAPFQKISSMTIDSGAIDVTLNSAVLTLTYAMDGVIYYTGNTSNQGSGEVGIYKMTRAGTVQKISYGAVDKLLNASRNQGAAGGIGFQGSGVMNGQKFIALTINGSTAYRYFYYPASGLWWRQNLYEYGIAGNDGSSYFASNGTAINETSVSTRATGTAMIRCGMDNYDTNKKKFISRVTVIGDRASTSANSTLKMYSNDYLTTLSSHAVDMSLVQPIANRCGAGYNIAPEFYDSNTQHIRIRGFDVEYEEGT